MPLNLEDIAQALATGQFDIFIGQIESSCFDAKSQPYVVTTDAAKLELAKDASAFANGDGGYILIGLRTAPSTVNYADEVVEVRPLPQGLVNTTQQRNILNDWIYPPIDGVSVDFHPLSTDASKGLIAIRIPKRPSELKPFLVVKSFDGTRHVETMFGYVQRKGDVNSPSTVSDLQRALRSGLNFQQELATRLDRIEALVATRERVPHVVETEEIRRVLDERIQRALRGEGGGTDA